MSTVGTTGAAGSPGVGAPGAAGAVDAAAGKPQATSRGGRREQDMRGALARNVKRLRGLAAGPANPAPRDARWWTGIVILVTSCLLLAFIAHAALLSALQYNREQSLLYSRLRVSLAQASAPVGQLDPNGVLAKPGTPVALIEIPKLDVRQTIVEGTTAKLLRGGPGHRRDTVMPGQEGTAVLMGRQATYGGPFRGLAKLAPGDTIRVTTGQGESTFRVIGLRRAGDPLPPTLGAGQGRLELETADGLPLFPDGALHVDAQLVGKVQQTPAKVLAYQALPTSELAMGSDGGAWGPAILALLAFAAAGGALIWLWRTWGRRQTWMVGVPLLLCLGVTAADLVIDALPNLV